MGPENKPETNQLMHDLEAAVNKIDGFFSGKINEIDIETEEVSAWDAVIKLGRVIKRKDQELLALNKLKLEQQRSRDFIVPLLDQVVAKYLNPQVETSD